MSCVTNMVDDVAQRCLVNPNDYSFFDEECCETGMLDQVALESVFPTMPHPLHNRTVRQTIEAVAPGNCGGRYTGFLPGSSWGFDVLPAPSCVTAAKRKTR